MDVHSLPQISDLNLTTPMDDSDASYVFVTPSDLNPKPPSDPHSSSPSHSSQNLDHNADNRILPILTSSDTGTIHLQPHSVHILTHNEIDIEVDSSPIQLSEDNPILEIIKLSSSPIQGQNEVFTAIQSSSIMPIPLDEIEVKSSQNVEHPQIAQYGGTVAIPQFSDTIDNRSEEIEVASFEIVEDIQESHDANLEDPAFNCVNGIEKNDEIVNKSAVEEIRESQITTMCSAKSEPDQPDDLAENTEGGCSLGLPLIVENSEKTRVTSKDGENNHSVAEEQAGSSNEIHILEPSADNQLDMEQNLAAGPCLPFTSKLETENSNGTSLISNEDGLPTSMDQDGPLDTNDAEDNVANKISFHDDTRASPASVNCEIAIIETHEVSPPELVSDPKIDSNDFPMGEPNHVSELDEGSETASFPIVDECVKVEVLGFTVSDYGDDMPIGQDESRISEADDSVSESPLIPEGTELLESIQTTVAAVMIGNAPGEMRSSCSTDCLNDPVLKPDSVVEVCTKSDTVAPSVDDVQPDKQVGDNHDTSLLGITDLVTEFENSNTKKDNQSTFPSKNEDSPSSQPNAVETDSELYGNESSSVLCLAAKKESGDGIEITSSIGSRDMPGDACIVSESEVLKPSLVNNERDLNTISDVAVSKTDAPTKGEIEAIHDSCQDEPLSVSPEGSAAEALEGQNVSAEAGTRPFYFLVRVPRYDDYNIREKITFARSEVDRKTQDRDVIRVQIQTMRATMEVFINDLESAKSEERAARELLKSKRQEIDSAQSVMTKVKNAMSVEDIDGRIRNIEHMIEHETVPLKEEKQLIREIKQLKQLREQLSSTMGKQDDLQWALGQKEQIEERLKLLRKEVDLLRDNVQKAESVTKAAKKKYNDENIKLDELQSQFKAADKTRQEAYANLQGMKKQLYEKSKFFWKYQSDVKEANDLASSGNRERLQQLCLNQVETMMELWNKNDEFRKDYIRCNMRSTLRRLRTLDGRSLGPNEEPPVLTNIAKERSPRDNPVSVVSTQEREKLVPAETVKDNDKPVIKVVETKNQTTRNKKPDTVAIVDSHTEISGGNEVEEALEVKIKLTKEEEELAAKAEELRKEEEAAKLKEQRKLEEKTKAKEALERKKRNAERAQAKAMIKARKEAEEREKQKEKRAKKKERKVAAVTEAGNGLGERESAEITESPTKAPEESENTAKEATATKRSKKVTQYTKQSKAKSIPPPLRNRGKRRMQPWMWVLLTALFVFILFFVGQQRFLH